MSELPSNVASRATINAPKSATRARAAMATAATLVLAAGLSACSATPDAVKPDMLYGNTAAADAPEGTKGFPELVNTPVTRPAATSASDQKAIAEGLAEDRDTARSNDAALRSGVEPSTVKPSVAEQKAAALAAENEPVAGPVVVAAATPAAVPAPSRVAAEPAPVPAPAVVAAAVPVVAPAPEAEPKSEPVVAAARPVAPKPAPVVAAAAPVRASAPVFAPEPAANDVAPVQSAPRDMMAMADTAEPVAETAPALETRPLIVNGVIPMPARGGHKSYADVKKQRRGGDEEVETASSDAEPAAETNAGGEAPVTAAPTQKVIVKPVVGPTP